MPTKNYDDLLLEQLQDPKIAAEYLLIALEEGLTNEFLLALRNVAEAHNGVRVISRCVVARKGFSEGVMK